MMEKDIQYINDLLRQYRDGSITDKDRHVLEKIALDDPMVFDAMEGFSLNSTGDHSTSLDRLKSKTVSTPSGRIINMRTMSIAAGLIILVGAMMWVNGQFDNQHDTVVSQAEVQEQPSLPELSEETMKEIVIDSVADFVGVSVGDLSGNAAPSELLVGNNDETIDQVTIDTKANIDANLITTSAPSNAVQVAEVTEGKESVSNIEEQSDRYTYTWDDSLFADPPASVIAESETAPAPQPASARLEQMSSNDAPSQVKTKARATSESAQFIAKPEQAIAAMKTIQGRVRDITGEPLIGASIFTTDGSNGIATDIDGTFEMDIDPSVNQLLINYVGYEDLVVELDTSQSNYDLVLEEGAELDEVVVVGYGANYNASNQEPLFVSPPGGRANFKKIIAYATDENSCGEKGKVRLIFIVDRYGNPSDFRVKKSLTPYCNDRAIRIIKDAGTWDNQTNKDKKVRYTVTFESN